MQKQICYKRFRGKALTGEDVNIPAMTSCHVLENIIYRTSDDYPICVLTSQNGIEHFCSDEDNCGEYRGKLIRAITKHLAQPDWRNELYQLGNKQPQNMTDEERVKLDKIMDSRMAEYQRRWDVLWTDEEFITYKRKDHADVWLWDRRFYDAPIDVLERMATSIGLRTDKIT